MLRARGSRKAVVGPTPSLVAVLVLTLLVVTIAGAQPPYQEHGTVGGSGTSGGSATGGSTTESSSTGSGIPELPPPDPHPDPVNTAACKSHGTSSPYDPTYAAFESSLVGPRGGSGLTIEDQVEFHHLGGASISIIEGGQITQNHWYGCRDRAAGIRTTASTIYQTASLSKFVSAVGLTVAHRQGAVGLGRSMQSYAESYPNSLLAEWVDENFDDGATLYPASITIRRLLNHSGGLDTSSIGAWEADVPTLRDVILGASGYGGRYTGGVEPIHTPKTQIEYSGGGYIVAEHVLELASSVAFKDYLRQHVLDAAGMWLSTFDKAQSWMTNLARPFSRAPASSDVLQTNVKAAGGLLANAREYAELVTAIVNGGLTYSGYQVMLQSDLDEILTPAAHSRSSFEPCAAPGATRSITHTIELAPNLSKANDIGEFLNEPIQWSTTETCVAGQYREVLLDDSRWRGLGVKLKTTVEPDGYPRIVEHSGAQTGARTYFQIDRRTGDGIVIMINGQDEWVDGNGFTYGADPLLDAIRDAYDATY